jgi:hypothetical protein
MFTFDYRHIINGTIKNYEQQENEPKILQESGQNFPAYQVCIPQQQRLVFHHQLLNNENINKSKISEQRQKFD